jgi:hypothetical protein
MRIRNDYGQPSLPQLSRSRPAEYGLLVLFLLISSAPLLGQGAAPDDAELQTLAASLTDNTGTKVATSWKVFEAATPERKKMVIAKIVKTSSVDFSVTPKWLGALTELGHHDSESVIDEIIREADESKGDPSLRENLFRLLISVASNYVSPNPPKQDQLPEIMPGTEPAIKKAASFMKELLRDPTVVNKDEGNAMYGLQKLGIYGSIAVKELAAYVRYHRDRTTADMTSQRGTDLSSAFMDPVRRLSAITRSLRLAIEKTKPRGDSPQMKQWEQEMHIALDALADALMWNKPDNISYFCLLDAVPAIKEAKAYAGPIEDKLLAFADSPKSGGARGSLLRPILEVLSSRKRLDPQQLDKLISKGVSDLKKAIASRSTATEEKINRNDTDAYAHEKLEDLRPYLSPEKRAALDREISDLYNQQRAENVKDINLCDFLCKLATNSAWLKDYYEKTELNDPTNEPWKFAMLNLGALFILKTAPYCDDAKELSKNLAKQWSNQPTPLPHATQARAKNSEGLISHEFDNLKNISDKQLASYPAPTPQNGLADDAALKAIGANDAAGMYGLEFHLLFLKELQKQHSLGAEANQLQSSIEKTQDAVDVAYRHAHRKTELEQGRSGSLFITYLMSSFYLLLDDKELEAPYSTVGAQSPLLRADKISRREKYTSSMMELVDENDPLSIPYTVSDKAGRSAPKEDPKEEEGKTTPRGASGRAIPFYLALYLNGAGDEATKAVYRDRLIASLEQFRDHLKSLESQIPREGTHVGPDGLAPYFYYPNMIYATAATKLLLERGRLSDNNQETVRQVRIALKQSLLERIQKDNLFQAHNPREYPSSPGYVNPLAAIAAIPLLNACGGIDVKSLGIIDQFNI